MSATLGGPESGADSDVPAAPSGLDTTIRELRHACGYHAWMYSQVEDFIGSSVLEVGAGSGNLTQSLVNQANVTALDESRAALDVASRRVGDASLDTLVAESADPRDVALMARRGYDTVLTSNVLKLLRTMWWPSRICTQSSGHVVAMHCSSCLRTLGSLARWPGRGA